MLQTHYDRLLHHLFISAPSIRKLLDQKQKSLSLAAAAGPNSNVSELRLIRYCVVKAIYRF